MWGVLLTNLCLWGSGRKDPKGFQEVFSPRGSSWEKLNQHLEMEGYLILKDANFALDFLWFFLFESVKNKKCDFCTSRPGFQCHVTYLYSLGNALEYGSTVVEGNRHLRIQTSRALSMMSAYPRPTMIL